MLFDDSIGGPFDQAEQMAIKACEHYEDGQTEQAIRQLDQALEINPSNSCWHFDKALALDSLNRFDDAIKEYEFALQLSPGDAEILNALAIDYTRIGFYDLAIETFEQVEQLEPTFEPSYCNRIITYAEMGKHEQAEEMFYMAQQINSKCPLCYYNIGNSLYIRKLYKKAILCWQKASELDPQHPQINYRLAQACWANGDIEQAKQYFLEELRRNPADFDCIGDFGIFLLQTGEIESAREKFNRIIEMNPDCAPALFYLGEIAFSNNDFKKAIEFYEHTIEKDGAMAGPRYRLALCNFFAGKIERARGYLAVEMQLAPDNPEILVSMASIFIKLGDLDYASSCLLRAIDHDNECDDAFYLLGCINIIKQKQENAQELLSIALEKNPKKSSALKELAHLMLSTGNFRQADDLINGLKRLSLADPELKKLERLYRTKAAIKDLSVLFSRFKQQKHF
jgi:tetratricopeptide (TPR) repeat protein